MIGKFFGSKKVPINGGNEDGTQLSGPKVIKVFELELSNMEGSPAYSLTHQLTIGSEIGNIIIADPSVSPRHATFILQQEVVSVIDHGSVNGTLVNGKKIPSGRYIILEESDTVSVGDLEVKIRPTNQTINVDETPEPDENERAEPVTSSASVPEPESVAGAQVQDEEPLQEMQEEDKTPVPSKMSKPSKVSGISKLLSLFKRKPKSSVSSPKPTEESEGDKTPPPSSSNSKFGKLLQAFRKNPSAQPKKGKEKLALVISNANTYSANALVRVVAFILDLILSYAIGVIFWPFDEFRKFLEFLPAELANLLGVEWVALWDSFTQDFEGVRELVTDAYGFISGYVHIGPLLLIFFLLRFVTTLLFGVSISQLLLSVGPTGNKIWARVGGMIRVLIGAITGPFLIFDVPAIVSRRTLKEFITFTNIQVRSKFIAIVSSLLLVPLFIALTLLSPIIQGFDPPESINVNDKLERRVKAEKGGEVAAPQGEPKYISSKFMNLGLTYHPEEILLVPNIKFQGVKNKLSYRSQLIFYHRELQRPVTVELIKTFDLQQLLSIGIKGNFFLYEKFPELRGYVYQVEGATHFKISKDEKAQTRFANEFMSFTKIALGLSLDNAIEVMEMETPFLKGLMDFRSSLLDLLEYKDFDEIGFIKIGNAIFMKVSYSAQKPFDLIIPLLKGEGRVFKVDYDKKESLSVVSSKFYKYTLDNSDWLNPAQQETSSETLNAFQVLDLLANLDVNKKKIQPEKAQALYGYYFEKSAEIFKRDDAVEYELWKKSLASMVKVIENLQTKGTEGAVVSETQANSETPASTEASTTDSVSETPAPTEEAIEDPVMKLKQNFRDLIEAVESKNLTYFGLTETQTI